METFLVIGVETVSRGITQGEVGAVIGGVLLICLVLSCLVIGRERKDRRVGKISLNPHFREEKCQFCEETSVISLQFHKNNNLVGFSSSTFT